jgi:hypothetical protein
MVIKVDALASPRIITVPISDGTGITIQNLLNQCREWEQIPANMTHAKLLDGAGKQDLGGSVSVGITLTLLNAKLAFEARAGPDYIQCTVSGGNLVAVDGNGDSMSPIEPTAYTQVIIAQSTSAASVLTGSGVTEQDKLDISDRVWDEAAAGHLDAGKAGSQLWTRMNDSYDELLDISSKIDNVVVITEEIQDMAENRMVINLSTQCMELYDDTGTVLLKRWPVKNKNGQPITAADLQGVCERGKRIT